MDEQVTAGLLARQERGRQIAARSRVRETRAGIWIVPSQSHPGHYVVDIITHTCTCPDHEATHGTCKHLHAVTFVRIHNGKPDEKMVADESSPRKTYPQDWAAYNTAQTMEKEQVRSLLQGLCESIVQPAQTKGRRRLLLSDVVYGSVMKVYTTVSGRRASTDIRECEQRGLIDHAPCYNSIFNYLQRPELTPLFKTLIEESATPLKAVESSFAVDSTGFGTCTYSRWYDEKYGKVVKSQNWVKAHAMIGARTNVVTSIEVTEGNVGDCPQLRGLVKSTNERFDIKEVTADKAYLSHKNLQYVASIGAQPYIQFKSNSQGKGSEQWQRLWHMFWLERGKFDQHYHQRSNVESTFSAVKRKFGANVRSKVFTAQVNEVLAKVLCFNLSVLVHEMHELGIKPEFCTSPLSMGVR